MDAGRSQGANILPAKGVFELKWLFVVRHWHQSLSSSAVSSILIWKSIMPDWFLLFTPNAFMRGK
jgi:hypothetical protein